MREIKFRAWDTINEKMIEHKHISVLLKNIRNSNQYIYEQFTGLHDKNGKEIYEGDILEWYTSPDRKVQAYVIWEAQGGRWGLQNKEEIFNPIGHRTGSNEIIGTVHDKEKD